MRLMFCPECGAVYVEGVGTGCVSPRCQGTHEWGPRPLEPVERALKMCDVNGCTELLRPAGESALIVRGMCPVHGYREVAK